MEVVAIMGNKVLKCLDGVVKSAVIQAALFAFVSVAAHASEMVVIEAESFEDWGGWVNDTQFMDQMGSPYLLAHGLGKPVADAKTTFEAKGGKYGVWARTKNWTAPWHSGAGAGTFNIVVNGEKKPIPFWQLVSWTFYYVRDLATKKK